MSSYPSLVAVSQILLQIFIILVVQAKLWRTVKLSASEDYWSSNELTNTSLLSMKEEEEEREGEGGGSGLTGGGGETDGVSVPSLVPVNSSRSVLRVSLQARPSSPVSLSSLIWAGQLLRLWDRPWHQLSWQCRDIYISSYSVSINPVHSPPLLPASNTKTVSGG